MAIFKKKLTASDRTTRKTRQYEEIYITGSIVSGTYGGDTISIANELHVKKPSHGKYQSVFDFPHLSSSANHLFDISVGVYPGGDFATGSSGGYIEKTMQVLTGSDDKYNMYVQMASLLVGNDQTGSVRPFDLLGDQESTSSQKIHSCVFLNFSRELVKDEIERGSFELNFGTASNFYVVNGKTAAPADEVTTISDYGAANTYKTNSPVGDYGILYKGSAAAANAVGLIYYQAGVAVLQLSSSIRDLSRSSLLASRVSDLANGTFNGSTHAQYMTSSLSGVTSSVGGWWDVEQAMVSGTVNQIADYFRHRVQNIQFNNITELNSVIYNCSVSADDFNYSTNPTYLSGSTLIVRDENRDGVIGTDKRAYGQGDFSKESGTTPVTFITTIGLYSVDDELLAVAKLERPEKNDKNTTHNFKVRFDF